MISNGKKVRIAFDLTVNGLLVQSVTMERPFCYVQGKRAAYRIPRALEKAVSRMGVGERRRIVLQPVNGFGPVKSVLVMEMPKVRFARRYHIVGKDITSEQTGKFLARVMEVRGTTLVLDFNHPYAGKALEYDLLVVGVDGQGMRPGGPVTKELMLQGEPWPKISTATNAASKRPRKSAAKKKDSRN